MRAACEPEPSRAELGEGKAGAGVNNAMAGAATPHMSVRLPGRIPVESRLSSATFTPTLVLFNTNVCVCVCFTGHGISTCVPLSSELGPGHHERVKRQWQVNGQKVDIIRYSRAIQNHADAKK